MKIFNMMLFKNLGGIEQAFLDYCNALKSIKYDVIPIISNCAAIEKSLDKKPIFLNPWGRNDIFAILKLKYYILAEKPDFIITHTTKDTYIARKAAGKVPVISVSHGYNFKHLIGKQHIIAITQHMYNAILKAGQSPATLSYIPNMINILQKYKKPKVNKVPTFGFMGRLVPIKGCDIFLKALAKLKSNSIKFKAVIAGDGSEKSNIANLIKELGLSKEVKMIGWVDSVQKRNFLTTLTSTA